MKAWTKKFLDRCPIGKTTDVKNVSRNGVKANKAIKFPLVLWMELSKAGARNGWHMIDAESAFAAGMAVGWAEHEKSVK